MPYDDLVTFEDTEAVEGDAHGLRVRVHGRAVWVPHEHMAIADGVIATAGDRGRLIVPRWVAIGLGLVVPPLGRSSVGTPTVVIHRPARRRVGGLTRRRHGARS
jgi:hypothetical protein